MVTVVRTRGDGRDLVLNTDRLLATLNELQREAAPSAMARAMNRTGTTVRTGAVRTIAKRMGLKAGDVRKGVTFIKASRTNLRVIIRASGRPLPLYAFQARQTKRGVSARAYGQRRTYPGTFIARMPNGKIGVFVRKRSSRLPIKQLFGPGLAGTAAQDDVVEAIQRDWARLLPERFVRELRFYTDRLASKRGIR